MVPYIMAVLAFVLAAPILFHHFEPYHPVDAYETFWLVIDIVILLIVDLMITSYVWFFFLGLDIFFSQI